MTIGILMIIISIFGMGTLIFINDEYIFFSCSYIWKMLLGAGTGINFTAILSIISTQYSNNREKAMGMTQGAVGVG